MLAIVQAYAHGLPGYEIAHTEFVGNARVVYKAAVYQARFERRQSGYVVVSFFSVKEGTQTIADKKLGEMRY